MDLESMSKEELIEYIKKEIKLKFDKNIEPEIEIIGEK